MQKIKTKLLILISFILIISCNEQNKQPLLIGEWLLYEIEGASYVECPDVIKIEPTKYKTYNECYGSNVEDLIEEGDWSFNAKENSLMFKNRIFVEPSFGGDDFKCRILILTENILKMECMTEDGPVIRTYKREY